MDKNLRNFLAKLAVFAILLFALRAIFQIPVEYFRLSMFYESNLTRIFSKGDAMKVIAFAGICFFLAFKGRIEKIGHPKIKWTASISLIMLSLVFVAAYYCFNYLTNQYGIKEGLELYGIVIGKSVALALAGLTLLLSVFQISYAKTIFKILSKEILITAVLMVIFYFTLMFFQAQWRFFSGIVAEVLIAFFTPFFKVNALRGSPDGTIITVDNFTISIAAPCSGIDSMLLFSALFGVIFALDHKHIRKGHFAFIFVLGLFGDFLVNNIRLFLLILVGVYISPKLAVGLFHTHAGWILFLLYFMGFYWFVKKFIYKKSFTEKK